MSIIRINLDDDVKKIIDRRAKKNLLTIKEQIEEIVRMSAIRTKTGATSSMAKVDDRLVEIFSRRSKGKKK